MKTIHIGCASGFWGDSLAAAPNLLRAKRLDYLVFDYLAEITMSILARAKAKNPAHGFGLDFVDPVLKTVLPQLAERGIKVVSNAGGLNPVACGQAIEALLEQLGLPLSVAVVTGDDLSDRVEELRAAGIREMNSGDPLPAALMSINAYLGAFPIAQALAKGADIVVAGRCVDSAVALGPCIHEFGWTAKDFDRLAGGSLAGHIIECGAQATGGLFTDWKLAGDWADIGYPIVEVEESGDFVVSKPEGTGGIVCTASVAEQLVYEIGDPRRYVLPDVVCDFSEASLEQVGPNRVKVAGAKGMPPTDSVKVCATYFDGYRIVCSLTIRGIEAEEKARRTFDAVLRRVRGMLKRRGAPDFTETHVEILGVESGYGPHRRVGEVREVVGRLGAKHLSEQALSVLLRELTSSGTSMAPGTTGDGSTRPKPSPVVRLFSFLLDKQRVCAKVHFGGVSWDVPFEPGVPLSAGGPAQIPNMEPLTTIAEETDCVEVPLVRIAHGRSGDKGNSANIGIIARRKEYVGILREQLTAERVAEYFSYLCSGPVERYELPGIGAFNFLLHNALGGGGIASLRQDPQGKALAQILLDAPVRVPREVVESP
jgi:hypothetical protein